MQVPLVLEDIVVLDGQNQPVRGLKASDFTITDNGKPVTPQSFEEHTASTPAQRAAQMASARKPADLGVNVFSNRTTASPDSPLNILLLDSINTPMTAQARVRQQMLKYLSKQPAGVRMAIFVLGSRLFLLQGFSSDPAVLTAAVNSKGAAMQASAHLDNPVSGGAGSMEQGVDDLANLLAMQGFPAGDIQANFQVVQTHQTTERVERTFAAMDQLARYLAVLPGRKNLIWFSGSFPIAITPNPGVGRSMQNPESLANYGESVRRTDDLLARSQVAVYPVDARGTFNDPDNDSSQSATSTNRMGPMPLVAKGKDFAQQNASEQFTMDQMAMDTGGKAFYNNGDLEAAVENAISFGSNYYSLSWTPPSGKWDGKYHKIDVKVNHPGLSLSYRRGYYADNPAEENGVHPVAQASAMQAAMLHGAPQPSGLLFEVHVIPEDGTTSKLSPGSQPNPKLMQPPYRSFTLSTRLDIHNVQMTRSAAGAYESSLEFTALVYNVDGDLVNADGRVGHFVVPPDRYADVLAHGLTASVPIDVPVKGTYFIRIGVHDPASNRVGAVEIPVASLQSKQATTAASSQAPAEQ